MFTAGVVTRRQRSEIDLSSLFQDAQSFADPRATLVLLPPVSQFPTLILLCRSERPIDATDDLPALVLLAREHLVGGSGFGERQHIADRRGQFASLDESRELFEALG